MIQLKALFVGAAMGILSTLAGVSLAKADCDQDGLTASELAAECEGDECAQLGWEVAVIVAQDRCDMAAEEWLHMGLSEDVVGGAGGMWEACVRLATPVGPLSAAQHYDTTDGAFWTVEP